MNGRPEVRQRRLSDWRRVWHALVVGKYWARAHTKHRLQYHLVWIPKYRKRVLLGKVAIRLKHLLYEAARVNRWSIRELSIQRDHVHMLLQIGPGISVARAVHRLKGALVSSGGRKFRNWKNSCGETVPGRTATLPRVWALPKKR